MNEYQFETLQVHAGKINDALTNSCATPIYATAAYKFNNCDHAQARFNLSDSGNIYSRLTNSTTEVLEQRLAALEKGKAALALASGAAAITYTLQTLAQDNGHIIASENLYGGSYNLLAHTLPHYGIKTTFIDINNLSLLENSIQDNTKAIFFESIANPNSDLCDIKAISEIAHRHGIVVVVDNTFATPYNYRPLELGADIVVHSATKYLGGHGTTLGGIIVDKGEFDYQNSSRYPFLTTPSDSYHGATFSDLASNLCFITYLRAVILRDCGATLSPFNAFLLIQGIETLSLRMQRHYENTLAVLELFKNHPKVKKINHPLITSHPHHAIYQQDFKLGGCSIFTIELDADLEQTKQFIDNLNLFSIVANVADVKSLVIHPATTTHSQLSLDELNKQHIYDNTVRFSIGIENKIDIINDLKQALAKL